MSVKKHTKKGYRFNYTQYVIKSWFADHAYAYDVGVELYMENFKDIEGDIIEVVCFTRLQEYKE